MVEQTLKTTDAASGADSISVAQDAVGDDHHSPEPPAGDGQRASDVVQAVRAGSQVRTRERRAGEVARVIRDPQGHLVTDIVVRTSRLFGRELVAPVGLVADVSPDVITLNATQSELLTLPEYRSDDHIAAEVDYALYEYVLDRPHMACVRASVENGSVTLRGHVATEEYRSRARETAEGVPGVREVRDRLVSDDDLDIAVAQALREDPRARPYVIRVHTTLGIVHLMGRLSSRQEEIVAEEIVSAVPGVRAIVSRLLPEETRARQPEVVSPRIGGHVFTDDADLGSLERVVIDPLTRRVTHLVVEGSFEPPRDWEASPPKRRVIPASHVTVATSFETVLDVDRKTAARFPEYWDEEYVAPPKGWEPPFDYQREEVLFALA